jgi:hypothetical protein
MLKNTLIRVWSKDLGRNYGNVVVAEVNLRRVNTLVPAVGAAHYRRDFPGAVLIDDQAALEPVATAIRRNHSFVITIAATDVFMWTAVRADQDITGYYTVECVPYVELARACAVPDDLILKAAHDDNQR